MASEGFRDYYKVLGVERNSTDSTIKNAFRKLAREYHPDMNSGDKNSEAKFKEINEAYEVLSDPDKRKKYEQYGKYWSQANQFNANMSTGNGFDVDFGGYGNFDEFINDLLGRFGGINASGQGIDSSNRNQYHSSQKGSKLDAHTQLEISFLEALKGTQRTLSVNDERVQVQIPKGIQSGTKLRVRGKGNFNTGMGTRGDLYILIKVKTHSIWKIDGFDICAELPVGLDELILGAEIEIIIPDGAVIIQIPEGTMPGANLRLKGKGWPSSKNRGDLIFSLKLQWPEEWSSEQKLILEELRKISTHNPRSRWFDRAR